MKNSLSAQNATEKNVSNNNAYYYVVCILNILYNIKIPFSAVKDTLFNVVFSFI